MNTSVNESQTCPRCGVPLVRINLNVEGDCLLACPGANCGWASADRYAPPLLRPEAIVGIVHEIEDLEDGDMRTQIGVAKRDIKENEVIATVDLHTGEVKSASIKFLSYGKRKLREKVLLPGCLIKNEIEDLDDGGQ